MLVAQWVFRFQLVLGSMLVHLSMHVAIRTGMRESFQNWWYLRCLEGLPNVGNVHIASARACSRVIWSGPDIRIAYLCFVSFCIFSMQSRISALYGTA